MRALRGLVGLTALALNLIQLSSTSSLQPGGSSCSGLRLSTSPQLTDGKGAGAKELHIAFVSGCCWTRCSASSAPQPFAQLAQPPNNVVCAATGFGRKPAAVLRRPWVRQGAGFRDRSWVLRSAEAEAEAEPSGFLLDKDPEGGDSGDLIFSGVEKVPFLRASFGMNDDVTAELWRAEPIHADGPIRNADKLQGRIALVTRGSSTGNPCSFVEKAVRVGEAGAVGMIVVNTEDSLISPGDSARAGVDLEMPVVGIKKSDAAKLVDGEEANLTFQPIATLNSEQRRYLRAVAMVKEKAGELTEVLLDDGVKSETVLKNLDSYLDEHEIVRVKFGEDDVPLAATLADLEDVVDVSTVLADNLGATVIAINPHQTILYRANPWSPGISVPADGDISGIALDLKDSMDATSLATPDDDPWTTHPDP